jgi:hypothetical protein
MGGLQTSGYDLPSGKVKMVVAGFSETLVFIYQITRLRVLDAGNL